MHDPSAPRTTFAPQARTFHNLTFRYAHWKSDQKFSLPILFFTALLALLLLVPEGAILAVALGSTNSDWPHLLQHVLPHTALETGLLALGVGGVSLVTGTLTAWVVTMYRFKGRVLLDRLLVLPLAIPTYIVAYCYVEIFDYGGPLQSTLRHVAGLSSARDYYFPEIHSLGGAIFILSLVLYPYVYLAARASFVQQSVCVLEVARTLGQTSLGAFWRIALPLARPALVAGTSLVLMETLNDLGAVQYLGVETLSLTIYTTWLQRSNLSGAAQICVILLLVVFLLLLLEKVSRGSSRYHHTTGRYRAIPFQDIEGVQGFLIPFICALPAVLGFFIPFCVLLKHALLHVEEGLSLALLEAGRNSALLAFLVATLALLIALFLSFVKRLAGSFLIRGVLSLAHLGYALPGVVLAIGVLLPFARFDNWLDSVARAFLGLPTGLLFSGTLIALMFALVVRFLTIAAGSLESGLEKISPSLDAAARSLGETTFSVLYRIHLPLLLPAVGAGALLVFVDTIKELPATLLLRPFNFETLATQVYALTALEQFERAAPSALLIVLVGLLPVLFLHHTVAGRRAGQKKTSASRPFLPSEASLSS